MRILWDFRLFSYGYSSRGIGEWTQRVAGEALAAGIPGELFIYGDPARIPAELAKSATVIPYGTGNWKQDLLTIPALCIRYKIEVIHYWVGLGPLVEIGMGAVHPCKEVVTIYDCGIALWHDVPLCTARFKSLYWKFQKAILSKKATIVCDSQSALNDCRLVFSGKINPQSQVVYCPARQLRSTTDRRSGTFFTLCGGANKNIKRVVEAFEQFSREHPDALLMILGTPDASDSQDRLLPANIRYEAIDQFEQYAATATACIVYSTHEGLGIPVLDAMTAGCPLVVSDIPVFREICGQNALFADPYKPAALTEALHLVSKNTEEWTAKSIEAARIYRAKSLQSGNQINALYVRK